MKKLDDIYFDHQEDEIKLFFDRMQTFFLFKKKKIELRFTECEVMKGIIKLCLLI